MEKEADEAGHCWAFENELLMHANELTSIPVEILGDALEEEIGNGRIVAEPGAPRRIYLKTCYWSERKTAERVKAIVAASSTFKRFEAEKAIAWWEEKSGFTL